MLTAYKAFTQQMQLDLRQLLWGAFDADVLMHTIKLVCQPRMLIYAVPVSFFYSEFLW
mgnify:FL=1